MRASIYYYLSLILMLAACAPEPPNAAGTSPEQSPAQEKQVAAKAKNDSAMDVDTDANKVGDIDKDASTDAITKSEPVTESTSPKATTPTNANQPLESVELAILSQKVALKVPQNWLVENQLLKVAFEIHDDNQYMVQFLPPNQSMENWYDIISIRAFENTASEDGSYPKRVIAGISNMLARDCDTNDYIGIEFSPISNNSMPNAAAMIGCNELQNDVATGILNKGDGEFSYYYAIQGKNDLYVIQRSWHKTKAQTEWDVLNPEVEEWRTIINQTQIID